MTWGESIWILQKIKNIFAKQTEYLNGQIIAASAKTQIFIASSQDDIHSTPQNGDIWFVEKQQQQSVSQEQVGG